MKSVTFTITGISPYSQSQRISSPKTGKETAADHESRCWRDRLHCDTDTGQVFIPPMAVKNALSEAAKFISMKVPGGGKATYTKLFEAGILCFEPIPLLSREGSPIIGADVKGEWLFVPASGKRGDGKRVEKCFPVVEKGWTGEATILIVHEMITDEVLRIHLQSAGNFIGLGRFRPRNNGFYGRFKVSNIKWSAMKEAA